MLRTLKILLLFFALLLIVYEIHLLWPSIGWNWMRVLDVVSFLLGLITSIIAFVSYRITQKHRNQKVYVSFPTEMKNEVDKFRQKNGLMPNFGTESLSPGNRLENEVKHNIARSSYCFVIINSTISNVQKSEIKEMKHQRKPITPIVIEGGKLPNQLVEYLPLSSTLEKIPELVVHI